MIDSNDNLAGNGSKNQRNSWLRFRGKKEGQTDGRAIPQDANLHAKENDGAY